MRLLPDYMKSIQNTYNREKPIILCGMMGAGKSAVGRNLAEISGLKYFDLDIEITQKENLSIPEIFDKYGESRFRQTEREVLSRLWQHPGRIISLGGGALQNLDFARKVREQSLLVYLKASVSVLVERVAGKKKRPLLLNSDGSLKTESELRDFLAEFIQKREKGYECAHIHFTVDNNHDVRTTAERLWNEILAYEQKNRS